MSQSDSFIDEVTEEVRRDRLFATFRKYGWVAGAAVLLIVGGASYYEFTRAQDRAKAQELGDAILSALETDDDAARIAALSEIQADTGDARAVVALTQAVETGRSGDVAAAVALLDGVATDSGVSVFYRSLAQFRSLALQSDTLSAPDRRAGYEELAGPGAPLRFLAMEQIAMTFVEEGNRDEAINKLKELQSEAGVTPDLLRRVSQLIVVLGGEAEAETSESDG